jgi:hypothetical protein
MKNYKAFAIISLLVLSTVTLSAQKSDVKPEGNWSFTAEGAEYGYNKGNLIISLEGKELKGELVFDEYSKFKTVEMKLEGNDLDFKVYIEGESVAIETTITKDEMKGKVSYSGGTIPFNATRKQ